MRTICIRSILTILSQTFFISSLFKKLFERAILDEFFKLILVKLCVDTYNNFISSSPIIMSSNLRLSLNKLLDTLQICIHILSNWSTFLFNIQYICTSICIFVFLQKIKNKVRFYKYISLYDFHFNGMTKCS